MPKIAIIGVGAIGGVVAALLETTKQHQITLCTRRPLEQLVVKTPEGMIAVKTKNLTDSLNLTRRPAAAGADWILVATKAYDAKSAAAWFQRLRNQDTPIAIIQNGVEQRENFSAAVNPALLLPVIIDCPAERQQDGSILQRGPALLRVDDTPLGARFAALFRGSKAEVILTADFLTASWQKLCLNAAGAILPLLQKPAGVLQDQALGQLVLDIIAEVVAVGKAEGAKLEDDIGRQILQRYRSQPPDWINSILADRLAGRPLEIEARNGVIVRKGARHGIPTPLNKMIVALLTAQTDQ